MKSVEGHEHEYAFAMQSLGAHVDGLMDMLDDDAAVLAALMVLCSAEVLEALADADAARKRLHALVDSALNDAIAAQVRAAQGDA